jgi:thymidylate kinase
VTETDDDRGRFLVVVGIDGSGKSTLLRRLDLPGTVVASWQDLRSHEAAATLAPDSPTQIRNRVPSLARAMFIGGHLVAQYEYLVRPRIKAGVNVVLDSYHYKLLAKERLFDASDESLERLCTQLPRPDSVVFVDVEPAEAFRRKAGDLSAYEHRGSPTRANFVEFQTELRRLVLEQLIDTPHVIVDGSLPPSELLSVVQHEIAEALDLTRRIEECRG